jgi:formate/nitrite transporter FocA (FNT family)
MYFIASGLFLKASTGAVAPDLTWSAFFAVNLLPVTLGNIVGGAGFGLSLWFIYCRREPKYRDSMP